MRAMVFTGLGQPLQLMDVADPEPGSGQLLIRVTACGICRTDLHVLDGDLTEPKLPLLPGHQIVCEVIGLGHGASGFTVGQRESRVELCSSNDGDGRGRVSGSVCASTRRRSIGGIAGAPLRLATIRRSIITGQRRRREG